MSRSEPLQAGGAPPPERVVIDTNVVLDAFWFVDPRAAAALDAVRRGELRWVATLPMRDELQHVLQRLAPRSQGLSPQHVLTSFDTHVVSVGAAPVASRLLCTDADDQKFIDLAVSQGARWLLTRDRALLKLAARAAQFGVRILVPERWNVTPPAQ